MLKFATTLIVATALGVAAQASPKLNSEIGTNVQTAVVVNSNNIALGDKATALQAMNIACGARIGTNVQTAVAVNSNNVALGRNVVAMQGSNVVGSGDCIPR